MMSGAAENGVSKMDIFLALADLSNKFKVFEANIIDTVEKKESEIDKTVHQQVIETKEIVVNRCICVEFYKVQKDIPGDVNIDLQEKQDLFNDPPGMLLLLNRKCISSYLLCNASVGAFGAIAVKFWFSLDKSDYFKPFKEPTKTAFPITQRNVDVTNLLIKSYSCSASKKIKSF